MYKLMIVEDEPLERKALRIILKKEFYNIDIIEDSKNGEEAVLKAKVFKPDIILMDIKMPEKTGLDAQKEIIEFLPNVKTIIITAYEQFSYAQTAIKYGVIDYLLKPIRPIDLKMVVNKALKSIEKVDSIKVKDLKSKDISENTIKAVLKYIDNNYSRDISLNTVANHVHLNSQYLSRYFKQKLGITFTQYVTNLKIEKAKKLLINTDKSITQVSMEVGFSDVSYFSKVFYKNENLSPYKFKCKYKNNL
ncbi:MULTISPECIES: response regulator transcription factor [Clostridium]|uniref:Stage 0 sporulation protein A homolog n=2 Tax=Clostridium TaxID=1485 RepID=A0A151AQ30_9CLOT|nr:MULTISPECIES: response regulator [Clostridium]KYH29507.1 putative response regulatory protein [Clostridium colicanis DSM 13634]PRR70734.1 putative response regulatory protein [Clostridium thermopalmarium DSM 5974]PVZ22584.1 YesN/AraC family two-component response regulator [Clostridium thermopalmarium DSM 5974]